MSERFHGISPAKATGRGGRGKIERDGGGDPTHPDKMQPTNIGVAYRSHLMRTVAIPEVYLKRWRMLTRWDAGRA